MTISNSTVDGQVAGARKVFVVAVIILLGAVTIGAVAAQEFLWLVGGLLGILFLLALLRWPDATTLLIVFYIYTNVGPVLMNYHGVPSYIAMGVPVLLSIPLISYLLLRREKLIVTPILQLMLLLSVVYILGAVFSRDINLATPKLVDYFLEGVLLYFFLTNVIRTPAMLKRVVWILLVSGAVIGGLSLYQQTTHTFDNNYGGFALTQTDSSFGTGVQNLQGEVRQSRLSGSIGEKNRYAQNMLMLVPLGLFQLLIFRSAWSRLLSLLFTGLIIAGGALAFSRGAAVGFVLLILIMAILRYIKIQQLLLLFLGAYLVLWMFPQYGGRIATLSVFTNTGSGQSTTALSGADQAIIGRETDIRAALLIFLDHPLIGVGPGMVQYYTQEYSRDIGLRYLKDNREAHSLFPGIAAESGILGLICFGLILYLTLRDLATARRRWMKIHPDWSNLATAFFLVLISYLATGLFLHMSYMRFFYLMLALASVVSNFREAEAPVETVTVEAAALPAA